MHPLQAAYNAYKQSLDDIRNLKHNTRKIFGAHLRACRLELGMSVRELGEKIGLTGSSINQIEHTGKSTLKNDHIQEIVKLCYEGKKFSSLKADLRKEEES